jgi:hypothetical protein
MGEFYDRERANEDWREWFLNNDIAIPLAWLCWRGIASPTDEAVLFVNETWLSFCEVFGIDYLADFDNLDSMLEFIDAVES